MTQEEKDLEAVKENGRAIYYVKKQTPELCLEAVKEDGYALAFVKNQTPELFDLMIDEGVEILSEYINIPMDSLSDKVRLYLV